MHNGSIETLEKVVAFYNDGGGDLKPLEMSVTEQADLVEFLKQLAGDKIKITKPELPNYELRELGKF